MMWDYNPQIKIDYTTEKKLKLDVAFYPRWGKNDT